MSEINSPISSIASPIKLDQSWLHPLKPEFDQPYMQNLKAFLAAEKEKGKRIFPKASEWFAALNTTTLSNVRVVILGQDPYHGENQAHGLCFSVNYGVKPPPSLMNIYKELKSDLGFGPSSHGNLTGWAQQGVLLLNSVLTVEAHQPASHQGKGWERFTDSVIKLINIQPTPVVFILWGSYAQKKAAFVNRNLHLVLSAAHPSPLSAYQGFFGSQPFSKTNQFLRQQGQAPINWQLGDG